MGPLPSFHTQKISALSCRDSACYGHAAFLEELSIYSYCKVPLVNSYWANVIYITET